MMNMHKQVPIWIVVIFLIIGVVAGINIQFVLQRFVPKDSILSPLAELATPPKELPLLKYSIPHLTEQQFQTRTITVTEVLSDNEDYVSFLFLFDPLGKKMSGQLNVPKSVLQKPTGTSNPVETPSIVMARGYVPAEMYVTGVGTKNAAAAYAAANFTTISPDFFGYGQSDPEPTDTWQARFEKPIIMAELITTFQQKPITIPASLLAEVNLPEPAKTDINIKPSNLGLWGHSNGGQIILTTLEIMGQPFPTTLWAPVTAPFPYSILFFTDELEDEGKASRLWVAQFEEDYDVFDFSLTKHLDLLQGPLMIHQGTADDAVLQAWSDEFVDKLETENEKREATSSALPAIDITYHKYPSADHNLRPSWDSVVQRDIAFFTEELQ
jgi:hypothetical protein